MSVLKRAPYHISEHVETGCDTLDEIVEENAESAARAETVVETLIAKLQRDEELTTKDFLLLALTGFAALLDQHQTTILALDGQSELYRVQGVARPTNLRLQRRLKRRPNLRPAA